MSNNICNISLEYDATKQQNITWVDSPNARGTLDILQSCVLTLVACIYTALHLDVPLKTAWHEVFLYKLKWVLITLFAPEISVYMAADQLQQAWSLKKRLLSLVPEVQAVVPDTGESEVELPLVGSKTNVMSTIPEISLKYAFFIIMGGVRVNVDDIISLPDLDFKAQRHFTTRPYTIRVGPKTIIQLAEKGYWINIPMQKIDDKSKADVLQKCLVMIQVSWMVMQCIFRKVYNLPLALLEVHTMVHVVCAMFLYLCWLRKPLNVLEPELLDPGKFKGTIALLVQQQFYPNMATRLALVPPQEYPDQPPPRRRGGLISHDWITPNMGQRITHEEYPWVSEKMWAYLPPDAWARLRSDLSERLPLGAWRWLPPRPGRWISDKEAQMRPGDVLPCGLMYHSEFQDLPLPLTEEFLNRWDAILKAFPFQDREELTSTSKFLRVNRLGWDFELVDPEEDAPVQGQDLFLARLKEFAPVPDGIFRTMPFSAGKRNLDINLKVFTENTSSSFGLLKFFRAFPWLAVLALLLSGIYGGVHLSAWRSTFPSIHEQILWKASGNFGTPITAALTKAGFEVTVISRTESTATFPSGLPVIKTTYTLENLTKALAGQDAAVCVVGPAGVSLQSTMIDAAEAAGVKRFIIDDFGWGPDFTSFPEFEPIRAQRLVGVNHVKARSKANPSFTWTGIATGNPVDWALKRFPLMGFDISNNTALIYDSGTEKFTGTTLEGIGQSVVGVLQNPEATANRTVKVMSIKASQNELLQAFESVSGSKWDIQRSTTKELIDGAREKHEKGDRGWILALAVAQLFNEGKAMCLIAPSWEESDSKLLGVAEVSPQELAATVLGVSAG
ncbi:hypothetical protein NW757_007872 [Fusarium falciforme]|nr:hypothetical protein NW757_007872 [Fusarium falciforme]